MTRDRDAHSRDGRPTGHPRDARVHARARAHVELGRHSGERDVGTLTAIAAAASADDASVIVRPTTLMIARSAVPAGRGMEAGPHLSPSALVVADLSAGDPDLEPLNELVCVDVLGDASQARSASALAFSLRFFVLSASLAAVGGLGLRGLKDAARRCCK
jgi:hypothetical protein